MSLLKNIEEAESDYGQAILRDAPGIIARNATTGCCIDIHGHKSVPPCTPPGSPAGENKPAAVICVETLEQEKRAIAAAKRAKGGTPLDMER